MVHKIIQNKYRVFIETLIITLLILLVGFFMGFLVETTRVQRIVEDYKDFEVSALDLRLQNYYYQIMDQSSCEKAIEQNFIFADNIYNGGLIIERYEQANDLTDEILLEKKKYVLLKTELWLNTILLKEKCGNPFDSVVYVYSQYDMATNKEAEQKAVSNILKKLKEEKGNEIILIPIAGDLGLGIVDMQLEIYNINYYPSIIINEEHVLEGFYTLEDLETYLN